MNIKFTLLRTLLTVIGLIKGEKYKYSQEYEDNFKYMDLGEKLWWGYKSVVRQIEHAEKGKGIEEYFANQELCFGDGEAFSAERRMILTAGGDLNASDMIYPGNTEHLWDDVRDFFFTADIIAANLEAPILQSKPAVGVPLMCLTAPKLNMLLGMFDRFTCGGAGINFYATANNHSLDQGEEGIISTRDFLDAKGYAHVGTARTREEQDEIPVIEKNGIKIAFVSYTYCLNGEDPIPGKEYMTNVIRLNKPDTDISLIEKHVRIARAKGADMVAAILHWSIEFETYPIENIIKMGHRVMECGIDIILGGHPHVAQPMEKYRFYDPYEKREKEGLIVYSLGELVSLNYFSKNSRLAYLVRLELSKGMENGILVSKITGLKVMPIHICYRELENGRTDYRVLDLRKTLAELKRGKNPHGFDKTEIRELERLEQLCYQRVLPRDNAKILP